MSSILILHGPNLNLLGQREPDVYGKQSLADIDQQLVELGQELDLHIHTFQSNSEGALIDALHAARQWASGVVINPGGYAYTSVSLADAIRAIDLPVIEVHMSNIFMRENFRRDSLIAPACVGVLTGFGLRSYALAVRAMAEILSEKGPAHHIPLTS